MRKVNQQRSRQFPLANRAALALKFLSIERFHSRDQQLCKFIGTRGSVYISGVLFVSLLLNFIGHRAVHEGFAKRLNEK